MKASPAVVRVHRLLGYLAVLYSVLVLSYLLIVLHIGHMSWTVHHLWVGLASLWLLWPFVLALHPGRSAIRVAVPMVIALLFLLPCFRHYRAMAAVTFGLPLIHYEVTYYDRNGDGIVDFEFHHATNAYDADWGLSDSEFRGRYDLKRGYSPFGKEERVDLPVPKHVKITPGEPQLWRVR
jgi:hypothetical protein